MESVYCNENTIFNNTFYRCESLKEIWISGNIGKDLDLSYSPLLSGRSVAYGVLMKLVNYSGTEYEGVHQILLCEESWKRVNEWARPSEVTDIASNDWKEYANLKGWLT